jgi:AcrR family transcriptional regulator
MKRSQNGQGSQKRRKAERPEEIKAAALRVFAERGFGGATVGEIAYRAGVVPGSIYRYYENKEELFRAVVTSVGQRQEKEMRGPLKLDDRVKTSASMFSDADVLSIARLLLVESCTFPSLASNWHDTVVLPVLVSLADYIRDAQRDGEIQAGDPSVQAFSVLAPLIMTALFQRCFPTMEAQSIDIGDLAGEHLAIMMNGLQHHGRRSPLQISQSS